MTWRSKASPGAPLGLLFIVAVLGLDGLLLSRVILHDIRSQQISFFSFVLGLIVLLSIPVLVLLAYHTASCITLRYRIDRNGITIRWFGSSRVIPIRDLQRIDSGRQLTSAVVGRRGIHWPGYERGEGAVPGLGRTLFLATQSVAGQLLLITPGLTVAISPHDPDGFLKALAARQELGPNRLLEAQELHARWLTWPLWTDRVARVLLGSAMAINLGLFAFLCARFPRLDLQLPLHWRQVQGVMEADRIGTRGELFALPIIGLIILGTNLLLGLILYRRERAASYLLWGAAAAAQAFFWLAALSIVR